VKIKKEEEPDKNTWPTRQNADDQLLCAAAAVTYKIEFFM
jgi:hypothetical protein